MDPTSGHLHGEALALLKSRVRPIAGTETIPLGSAAGRILAAPVLAPHPVPAGWQQTGCGTGLPVAFWRPISMVTRANPVLHRPRAVP